ncbi:MAG: hypothetical protein R2864_05560 [Syntrophotaleaceae bacterium]
MLDLYPLDRVGTIRSALRILPGRFDPAGWGTDEPERIRQSAAHPGLCRTTPPCTLVLDYGSGLATRLPGRQSHRWRFWSRTTPASLSRYGGLMAGLDGDRPL